MNIDIICMDKHFGASKISHGALVSQGYCKKYHKLDGLKNRKLLSHSSGGKKSAIQVSAGRLTEHLTASRWPPCPILVEEKGLSPLKNSSKGALGLGAADLKEGKMRCWTETRESEHSKRFLKQVVKDQKSRSLVDFSRARLEAGRWCSCALETVRGKDSNQKFYSSKMTKQVWGLKKDIFKYAMPDILPSMPCWICPPKTGE